MLKEVQVAELLRRCEAIAGRDLKRVRGSLRNPSSRAEAVWELIFAEAAAQVGDIEFDPVEGGPDVRLPLPTGRCVSIEVTYLHPRFDDDDRRSELVAQWMHEAAASLGPNAPEIRCQFHGDKDDPAGPRRTLPQEHERKKFLADAEVAGFLKEVAARPADKHQRRLNAYSVTLTATPYIPGTRRSSGWGGLVQEVPKVVDEHAAFRALRAKLRQHKVDEPHIVCIGSDVSPVLSSVMPFGIRTEQALGAALGKSRRLSGVMVVNIASSLSFPHIREARGILHPVRGCRYPLTEAEWSFIREINLNRWKYTFPLSRREVAPKHRHRDIPGSLGHSPTSRGTVKVTIPAPILVDVLAGRAQLLDHYGGPEGLMGQRVTTCLQDGWSIVGCSFKAGDIQQGTAALVELVLAPPHDPVFWPRR